MCITMYPYMYMYRCTWSLLGQKEKGLHWAPQVSSGKLQVPFQAP